MDVYNDQIVLFVFLIIAQIGIVVLPIWRLIKTIRNAYIKYSWDFLKNSWGATFMADLGWVIWSGLTFVIVFGMGYLLAVLLFHNLLVLSLELSIILSAIILLVLLAAIPILIKDFEWWFLIVAVFAWIPALLALVNLFLVFFIILSTGYFVYLRFFADLTINLFPRITYVIFYVWVVSAALCFLFKQKKYDTAGNQMWEY